MLAANCSLTLIQIMKMLPKQAWPLQDLMKLFLEGVY